MTINIHKTIIAGIGITALLAGTALTGIGYIHADQGGDVKRGEMLFNDPTLGGSTNDKSCGSCHPGGKGLENASGDIADTVNRCIKNALAGEGLDVYSQEMKDISAYIKSLKK